ncbi:MAG: hypothetical protein AAFX95_22230 [Cyanobacteria bacterium J06639_16]
MSTSLKRPRKFWATQPIDKVAIALMAVLTVIVVVLIALGGYAAARVREFSWHERQVGAEDTAFLFTFSRPMDHVSVETNLKVNPPLQGKFSWAGRRMAFTLDAPAPYGEFYQVSLETARDRYSAQNQGGVRFASFKSQFQSRDRALVYIGVDGEEQGRLVLFNLTQQDKVILTPPDLVVLDFKPYPAGDRVLFTGIDAQSYQQGTLQQALYSVTTGITANSPKAPGSRTGLFDFNREATAAKPAGEIELILDSDPYQNFKFDLSADGEVIIVQRVNTDDPTDFGPWIIHNGNAAPLNTEPGGDFAIAPDSRTLVMLQGQGTAIIPLPLDDDAPPSSEPLDFLPDYGRVLDISADGGAAAMVNFNQNNPDERYTESLFLVTNQGEEKNLLTATGTILSAQFDTTGRSLYVLSTELLDTENYVEQPILSAINLEQDVFKDLLALPPQPTINMSLAPDGLALLFDRMVPADSPDAEGLRSGDGRVLETSQIWLLPLYKTPAERLAGLPTSEIEPQTLPFTGVQPTWLP